MPTTCLDFQPLLLYLLLPIASKNLFSPPTSGLMNLKKLKKLLRKLSKMLLPPKLTLQKNQHFKDFFVKHSLRTNNVFKTHQLLKRRGPNKIIKYLQLC